ncbi:unnamed protein product [Allacma fusca]|uniref:Transmembrane protein n=1 Tax=Allacma fusca TaxID=39272 RepID=A0A8J2K323_9HEXA|nr:unnamed protein product [Allacma fusca]
MARTNISCQHPKFLQFRAATAPRLDQYQHQSRKEGASRLLLWITNLCIFAIKAITGFLLKIHSYSNISTF